MGNSLAVSINQEFKKNRNSFDLKNNEIKCMRFSEQFNLIGTKWFIYLQENSSDRIYVEPIHASELTFQYNYEQTA